MARGARNARGRRGRRRASALVLLAGLLAVLLGTGAAGAVVEAAHRLIDPSAYDARPYADAFRAAGERYPQVSPSQLAAMARAESGFDPDAVSPVGAQGLMQFMPETFAEFGVSADGDADPDPFDPDDAILSAANFLTWLGETLGADPSDDVVVAAYNAGPGAVERAGGVPDYPETRTYVERVAGWTPDYRWLDA